MPAANVHAIVVARPDARDLGYAHFRETLDALRAQTLPIAGLTVVLCGSDKRFATLANESGATTVLQMDPHTSYAVAVRQAAKRLDDESAVWLLAQDTTPAEDALKQLASQLDLGPSVMVVAPKLVRKNEQDVLASLGVSMTPGGRAVELGAGQFDQGQHDARTDVLGADVRGLLFRRGMHLDLLPDPALAGADEGLDIGVRAHLDAHRVVIAPKARVLVSGDGVAGMPEPKRGSDRRRIAYASRLAQLHRRLTYAPVLLVPLHILSFLPILLWRAVTALADKQPHRVLPEAGATIVAATRWPTLARSRSGLNRSRGGWVNVDSLRVTKAQRRTLLGNDTDDITNVRRDLHFFSGGGAWAVLASLAASVVMFPLLLGWPVLGGGGLLPMRGDLGQLWADAAFGLRGYGLGYVAPADPFAGVIAVLGSLSPVAPSLAIQMLWLLALPLATLGGWFAATRFTERSGLRLLGALAWTVAPTFMAALLDPRPAAVLAHLVLPWLVYVGVVAHRSWGYAGTASILLAVLTACAPSLGAIIIAFALVGLLVAMLSRRFTGAGRLLWTVIPTLAVFAPLAWRQFRESNLVAVLADPGAAYQGARASTDMQGSIGLLMGDATGSSWGWPNFLSWLGVGGDIVTALTPFIFVLAAPILLLALASGFTKRFFVTLSLLVGAGVFGVAAVAAARTSLAVFNGEPVSVWPGSLWAAGWLALVGAALVTLDELARPAAVRRGLAAVAALALGLSAVPSVTAVMRGEHGLTNGPTSTLPAYVAATLQDGEGGATLVLTMLEDGSIAQRIVWGASDTLGAQSTVLATRQGIDTEDTQIANVVADLVTPESSAPITLDSLGIRFVLVEPVVGSAGVAATTREQAVSALTQRAGLQTVGETGKGALWQVEAKPVPRTDAASASKATIIAIGTALVLLIAFLVALPTRGSVRAARTRPRGVGLKGGDE